MSTQDELLQHIRPVEPPRDDLAAWLAEQDDQLPWLLAHTYAGVVWGARRPGGWALSSDFDGQPPLVTDALLELRLFGPPGEIFVWRDGDALRARALYDGAAGVDSFDEEQMLWGSAAEPLDDVFSRARDGDQGMEMIIPLRPTPDQFTYRFMDEDGAWRVDPLWRPLRLVVRHYVTHHPETGLAQFAAARLVDLTIADNNRQEAADVD